MSTQNISNSISQLRLKGHHHLDPKSDQEFFDDFCKFADVVFNSGDKEVIFIKDKELNTCYLSSGYHDFLSPDAVVALNYRDELSEEKRQLADEMNATLLAQDRAIRDSGKPKNFLFVDVYETLSIVRKRPIINPATGHFVGILGTVRPYNLPNVLGLIYRINGVNYGMANKVQKESLRFHLTERQHMVLFLYLNKYSNTEIAEILTVIGYKISRTRVNDHLENLKYIFHVKTKEQLIEKAISYSYHLYIPRNLLKIGSYELADEVIISAYS